MPLWEAPESFVEFVQVRHAELLRFAHVLTGDAHQAEDLVQDALERAGISWLRIRRQEDPEGYVRRTITNRFLNHVRARRRERLVADPPDRVQIGPEHRHDGAWQMLADLPRQQRAVLVLRFYADMSEAQVAEVLGCSVGTVKSNASRGLAKLRVALGHPNPVKGEAR